MTLVIPYSISYLHVLVVIQLVIPHFAGFQVKHNDLLSFTRAVSVLLSVFLSIFTFPTHLDHVIFSHHFIILLVIFIPALSVIEC